MAHCAVNKSSLYVDAADPLIEKLILDPILVGTKHREKLSDLIDKFKDKYGVCVCVCVFRQLSSRG